MTAIPMHVVNQAVNIPAHVNGQPVTFILDTGDAIGPVFNAADAQRLGLVSGPPLQVSGAGGAASGITETTADIQLGPFTYPGELGAIDPNLEGPSLLGLPFFSGRLSFLGFDFQGRELIVIP